MQLNLIESLKQNVFATFKFNYLKYSSKQLIILKNHAFHEIY